MNKKTNTAYRFFICYRHDDNQDFVEHIRSGFTWHYGKDNVFMDYDSIPGGVDWRGYILEQIEHCDALIIIIGPDWIERIKKDPFRKDDPVRIEIEEAFKQKKLVYPIYIKGAEVPDNNLIPDELKGILDIQGTFLKSGRDVTNRIVPMLKSIEDLLNLRASRKKEIHDLSGISFAPGLALAYYHNFLKTIGKHLVEFNDHSRREASSIKVSIDNKQVDTRLPLKIRVVIPHRIASLTKSLEGIKDTLSQAEIAADRRKFHLYARKVNDEYALIDFPTTITVLENWLERRLKDEGFDPESERAKGLELEELRNFEKSLNYWIDDQFNGPVFRSCIQVMQFKPGDSQFDWLPGLLDLR
jgi:nucleotide-binding STING sensor domain-containing protein/TIR domain-containing protein